MALHESNPTSDTIADRPEPAGDIVSAPPFWDHTLKGILFANVVTMVGAWTQHWPVGPVLWIYWGQSVVIGLTNVIRMLCLKDFSTDGFTSGGKQVPATHASAVRTAMFFSFHYGIFHVVYLMFLRSAHWGQPATPLDRMMILGNVLVFAAAHLAPLIRGRGNDLAQRRPNLGALMFYPYLRILPMHLTIIFGSMLPAGALPLFMVLKTGADVGMHAVERHIFRAEA